MKVCQEISFKGKRFYKLKTYTDCDYVGGIGRRALFIFTPLNQQNVQTYPLDILYYISTIFLHVSSARVHHQGTKHSNTL